MPIRFDQTVLPGLFESDGYIEASNRTPPEIAELIMERLHQQKIPLGDIVIPAQNKPSIVIENNLPIGSWLEDLGNGVYIEMVTVPSTLCMMGTINERYTNSDLPTFKITKLADDKARISFDVANLFAECPRHRVKLSSFAISKFPITQAQWKTLMGKNPNFFVFIVII